MRMQRCLSRVLLAIGWLMLIVALGPSARAEGETSTTFKHIPLQYIVALGDPAATFGSGAQSWGLWRQDPGPRGCLLTNTKGSDLQWGLTPFLYRNLRLTDGCTI